MSDCEITVGIIRTVVIHRSVHESDLDYRLRIMKAIADRIGDLPIEDIAAKLTIGKRYITEAHEDSDGD